MKAVFTLLLLKPPQKSEEVRRLCSFYRPILPTYNHSSFVTTNCVTQYQIWKQFWECEINLPKDSIAALESCDANGLRIIYNLLKILAIQPVYTASPGRTFSIIRLLNTW